MKFTWVLRLSWFTELMQTSGQATGLNSDQITTNTLQNNSTQTLERLLQVILENKLINVAWERVT